mmetsp:Transcript_21941/g.60740  ORF Transcript_21941/g.60740 Transcript_21941/m.60740 type:complete len:82 (+) Transcript_21941:561-806(+)
MQAKKCKEGHPNYATMIPKKRMKCKQMPQARKCKGGDPRYATIIPLEASQVRGKYHMQARPRGYTRSTTDSFVQHLCTTGK